MKQKTDTSNMIYGIRAVIEAIDAGKDLERIFIQKDLKGELIRELLQRLPNTQSPVSRVPVERLKKFTTKNHQGVVAFASPVKHHQIEEVIAQVFERGEIPFVLLLDRITDVRNFGAIARTAEASGVHAIVIPMKYSAQVNPDAMKTSAGALAKIPVCRVEDILGAAKYLQSSGLELVACSEKGKTPLHTATLDGPLALILGSEEDGVSIELMAQSNEQCFIPMAGSIASLNVSAAGAIFMYEALRQRIK
jgi:23S rRNA (guanosine2251-2'-O)-methyltransferase